MFWLSMMVFTVPDESVSAVAERRLTRSSWPASTSLSAADPASNIPDALDSPILTDPLHQVVRKALRTG